MEQARHFDIDDSAWTSCLAPEPKGPTAVRQQMLIANSRDRTEESEQFMLRNINPRIVLVGGSTTVGSITQSVLNHMARLVCTMSGLPEVFGSEEIDLPMFAPDSPARTPAAVRLIEALRASNGIILVGPSCQGTISGMLKNALDYTEDLAKDPFPYFHGRAVGLIATEASSREMGSTMMSLRSVVHALRGWPTPLGITITSGTIAFDREGECVQPNLAIQLNVLAQQVMGFARNANDIGNMPSRLHLQDSNI
jgi:FMN reductase